MRYLALFLLWMFVACGAVKNKKNKTSIIEQNFTSSFEPIQQGKALFISRSASSKDSAQLTIDYMYFNVDSLALLPYKIDINSRICDFARSITGLEEVPDQSCTLSAHFFQQQLQQFDSLSQEELSVMEEANFWELQSTIIISEFEDYCELQLSSWSYTGGAHGNGFTEYFLIDHVTSKELKLQDFISDIVQFTEIANRHFRTENGIEPMADLNELGFWFPENEFACNENFYFDENEIHFQFNSYEIAPYSAGAPSFSIPLDEIEHLLKRKP